MPWDTIKFISLLEDRGSGHVMVAVTPLGSGVTTDEVRLGSCQKVGVTTVRVSSSRQRRSMVYMSPLGALRVPRRLCDRKSQWLSLLVHSFARSFPRTNYLWPPISTR